MARIQSYPGFLDTLQEILRFFLVYYITFRIFEGAEKGGKTFLLSLSYIFILDIIMLYKALVDLVSLDENARSI